VYIELLCVYAGLFLGVGRAFLENNSGLFVCI